MNYEPRSLEAECPHIVKVLLVLMKTLDGHNYHFAHPIKGFILNNIFNNARDSKKFVVLTSVMHSLSTMSSTLYPGMHTAVETFNILHIDVLALFDYELDKQIIVVKKVKAFIGRIAH